jgi:uncharacterized protein (TIGR03067 family)
MTRTYCLALMLPVLSLVFSSSLHAADEKSPLLGNWTVVKAEEDGKPVAELLKAKFTFKDGDKLLVKLAEEAKPLDAAVKLDAAKKPKQIDITRTVDARSETALGIYEVDGDKLKLCVAEAEVKERPTEFKSKSRKVTYVELTRDKP